MRRPFFVLCMDGGFFFLRFGGAGDGRTDKHTAVMEHWRHGVFVFWCFIYLMNFEGLPVRL